MGARREATFLLIGSALADQFFISLLPWCDKFGLYKVLRCQSTANKNPFRPKRVPLFGFFLLLGN